MNVKGRPVGDAVRNFKFQSQRDDCWATCIHNILEEHAERIGDPSLRLSESKLNQLMGYGARGRGALSISVERVVPDINRHLARTGHRLVELSEVTFEGLKENLADQSSSLPVAGLSYEYLVERHASHLVFEQEPPAEIDHTVVVLDPQAAEVVVFDPLDRFGKGGGGGDGIITLSTPSFLRYWSRATVDRQWIMYLARVRKRGESRPIEDFGRHKS